FQKIDKSNLPPKDLINKSLENFENSAKELPEKYMAIGFIYHALGNYSEALRNYFKCIELDPECDLINYFVGVTYFELENYPEAGVYFQKELKQRPKSHNTTYLLGITYLKLGNSQQASACFNRAIKLKPDYVKAYIGMSSAYRLSGNYKQAEKWTMQPIKAKKETADVYFELGEIYSGTKNYDLAEENYRKAIAKDPMLSEGYINLSKVLMAKEKYEEAFKLVTRAEKYHPQNIKLMIQKAIAVSNQKKYKEALKIIEEIEKINKNDQELAYIKGKCLLYLENAQNAINVIKKAIEANPNDLELRKLYGIAMLKLDKFNPAENEFKNIIKINADDPFANYYLGTTYFSLGDTQKAIEFYKKSADLIKNNGLDGFVRAYEHIKSKELDKLPLELKNAGIKPIDNEKELSAFSSIQLLTSAFYDLSKKEQEKSKGKEVVEETTLTVDVNDSMTNFIINACDGRDGFSYNHSRRVSKIALRLAKHINQASKDLISDEDLKTIELGGLLHDIGMMYVPRDIISKKKPLTNEEFSRIAKHTEYGEIIVKKNGFQRNIIPIVRNHHEKINGNGYPDKMSQNQIPLSVMIVSIADAFEAMVSARPYREGYSIEKAVATINKRAGIDFAPGIVNAFMDIIPEVSRIIAEIH
ncbi:tetratricopeptide repeat protein, partial [bacterium]|nr:tetratricopeptide repeat protein [bacterium]